MKPDLGSLEGMVLEGDKPVFNEPWQAQAFAMTIALYDKGLFAWDEWANALSKEIHSGEEREYYRHWLAALEAVMLEKGLSDVNAILKRETEWHEAAARTPHGKAIEL